MKYAAILAASFVLGASSMLTFDLSFEHIPGALSSYIQMVSPLLSVAERHGYEHGKRDYATLKSTVTQAHIYCNSQGDVVVGDILVDNVELDLSLGRGLVGCVENIDRRK